MSCKQYLNIGFWWVVLSSMFLPLNALEARSIEEMIQEGQRQLSALMEQNHQNELMGQPENNVYVFSMLSEDDWHQYITLNSGLEDMGHQLVMNINNKLKTFHAKSENSEYAMYVCYISHIPVDVRSFFPGTTTVSQLIEDFKELDAGDGEGQRAAASIKSASDLFSQMLYEVHKGVIDTNIFNFNIDQKNYKEIFLKRPNQLLFGRTKILAKYVDISSDEYKENRKYVAKRISTQSVTGIFKEKWDELSHFMLEMRKGRVSDANDKLKVDIESAMDFIEKGYYNNSVEFNHVIDGRNKHLLATEAYNPDNIGLSSIPNGDDLSKKYVFDFAGALANNSSLKAELDSLFNGELKEKSSKLKFFITDDKVPSNIITWVDDIFENLENDPEHNTILFRAHILPDGKVESNIKYHPELLKQLTPYFAIHGTQKMIEKAIDKAYEENGMGGVALYLTVRGLYQITDLFVKVLDNLQIPRRFYDVNYNGKDGKYNPMFKDVLSWFSPSFFDDEIFILLKGFGVNEQSNIGKDEIVFAFQCGVYNGLLDEMKGVGELIKMMTGYFVDDTERQKIDQMIAKIKELDAKDELLSSIKDQFVEAHKTEKPTLLAHQIGKDVVGVASIFAAGVGIYSAFSKGAKLSKVSKTFVNIFDKLDVVSTFLGKAGCVIARKGGQTIEFIHKGTKKVTAIFYPNGKVVVKNVDNTIEWILSKAELLKKVGYKWTGNYHLGKETVFETQYGVQVKADGIDIHQKDNRFLFVAIREVAQMDWSEFVTSVKESLNLYKLKDAEDFIIGGGSNPPSSARVNQIGIHLVNNKNIGEVINGEFGTANRDAFLQMISENLGYVPDNDNILKTFASAGKKVDGNQVNELVEVWKKIKIDYGDTYKIINDWSNEINQWTNKTKLHEFFNALKDDELRETIIEGHGKNYGVESYWEDQSTLELVASNYENVSTLDLVETWDFLYEPSFPLEPPVPLKLRNKLINLEFISQYRKKNPDAAEELKESLEVEGYHSKQRWLNLRRLVEEKVHSINLVKNKDDVYLDDLRFLKWGEELAKELFNHLQVLRLEMNLLAGSDDIGRWDMINVLKLEKNSIVAQRNPITINGNFISSFEINRSFLNKFQTYKDMNSYIHKESKNKGYAPRDFKDMINHEYAHHLTSDKCQSDFAKNLYEQQGDAFLEAVDNISLLPGAYNMVDSDFKNVVPEIVAEIFVAHKRGVEIPNILKTFFNALSDYYKIN